MDLTKMEIKQVVEVAGSRVFGFLSMRELADVSLVCKEWASTAQAVLMWKSLFNGLKSSILELRE